VDNISKTLEEAKRGMGRTEEQLAGILQQMPYPVEVLDRDGTVVMINKAFQELYGIANQQTVVGCFNIFREKNFRQSGLLPYFEKAYRGETVFVPEYIIPHDNHISTALKKKYQFNSNGDIAIEITIFPVFTHTGDIWRIVSIRKDISQLIEHKKNLEQKNIALKEILTQIDYEKKGIRNRLKGDIERMVLPYITKLLETMARGSIQRTYLKLMRDNLLGITSSLIQTNKDFYVNLSPREMEVCHLIKAGLTNKEIATTLSLSLLTVEKHRQHIRKKLGITGEQVNLHSYLQQTGPT